MNKFEFIEAMVNSKLHKPVMPTLQEVTRLSQQITNEHNAKAFEQIAIYRNQLPAASNAKDFNIMMVIWEAYENGKQIFERHDYSN